MLSGSATPQKLSSFSNRAPSMGKDEYATAGGALKLKGAKNAGIDKKRKRKKEQTPAQPTENKQTNPAEEPTSDLDTIAHGQDVAVKQQKQERESQEAAGKTEAEKRHEETRRRRV